VAQLSGRLNRTEAITTKANNTGQLNLLQVRSSRRPPAVALALSSALPEPSALVPVPELQASRASGLTMEPAAAPSRVGLAPAATDWPLALSLDLHHNSSPSLDPNEEWRQTERAAAAIVGAGNCQNWPPPQAATKAEAAEREGSPAFDTSPPREALQCFGSRPTRGGGPELCSS